MVVWSASWVLSLWLAGWLASGLTGIEGSSRFVWPVPATAGQVIEMVAAYEGESFVVLPSARGSLDARAPQVVPSEMSVRVALGVLREWTGLAAWRFEGVWVWFAEPAMPGLIVMSARGEAVSRIPPAVVTSPSPSPSPSAATSTTTATSATSATSTTAATRTADLDMEDARFPEVVVVLADAFSVRFVFSVAPGDSDRRLTLVAAGIDLETAMGFVEERFERDVWVCDSTVFFRASEGSATSHPFGASDDVAGLSQSNVVASVDVGATVSDICEGRLMLDRVGVASVPNE